MVPVCSACRPSYFLLFLLILQSVAQIVDSALLYDYCTLLEVCRFAEMPVEFINGQDSPLSSI